MAIWIEHVYTFFSSSMFISFHLHVLPMFHIASVSQSSKRASAFACAMRKRLSRARRRAVRSEGSSPTSLALPRRRNVLQMQDTIRYARSRYPRYAGSSRKPVSGLKQKLQQHCGQWHCLGCWNLLNNVECTANVALAGSWVAPRYRCPLDQLRLHSFAFPSPDLFQTCDFDCHSLVDLQIDLWLRLIGLAKWRPRATTCSKESKSKITSACAMIRFDFGCLRILCGFNSPRCNYPRARLCSLASFGQRM